MESNINNNEPNSRTPSQNGVGDDADYTSTPSRRNSASSQQSSSATSPNYDSGNASDLSICLRPASISEDEFASIEYGPDNRFQHLLREKDQLLFLALQDVRKLKSELERISKSEKWYKSELRVQKNSRMEILEKLYTNERKFTQENQRLQNECVALLGRCSDIESQLQSEKELTMNLLKGRTKNEESCISNALSRDFELEQNRQKLADQEQLIDMLRNQKRSLLKDLERLNNEKDEIILQMEKTTAQLTHENRTITKRCMQLVETKLILENEVSAKGEQCSGLSNEVLDLQIAVKCLQEQLHNHISELNKKDQDIETLKHELSQAKHSDEIAGLLQKQHQHELSLKEQTICSLNETISSLHTRVSSLEDVRARYVQQQNDLDQVSRILLERTAEIEELKRLNEKLSNQSKISEHQQTASIAEENVKLYQQNEALQQDINALQSKYAPSTTGQSLELDHLLKTQQDLKHLSDKYLKVCELYEKSKFESDMKDIKVEKFKFEKERDTLEIESLREKLIETSKKFECQKSLATEFEFALSRVQQEKHRLESEIECNTKQTAKLKSEDNRIMEELHQKDVTIEKLETQLLEMQVLVSDSKSQSSSKENETSEDRITLIQRLLSLQSEKVSLLNAEQIEWENLLTTIDSKVGYTETDALSTEFDDLNQLFADQNSELSHLNVIYQQQNLDLQAASEENQTLHQQLESAKQKITHLEQQLLAIESANADYQTEIANLRGKNERLVQEFNDDFSRERENNKKKTKLLKSEVDMFATENSALKRRVEQLEIELEENDVCQINDSRRQNDDVPDRILQNVLENEHRRKMNRYDVHIRSLLSTIKSYKKNLQIVEERYATLLAMSKEKVDATELQTMESSLNEMRLQFERSQREINDLKKQLRGIKDEFCGNDQGKASTTMDLTNLMDDYKKLIQQSQAMTRRPSTSEIYQLIDKSNKCVPKLTNISNSLSGLREDVQQFSTTMNQSSAGRGSPHHKMSLMDELKLAENGKLC